MSNKPPPPPLDGLTDLDRTLKALRDEEAQERSDEEARQAHLTLTWATLEPLINDALNRVFSVLARHGYIEGLEMTAPNFSESHGLSYGAECRLLDTGNSMLIVLSDDVLYINANMGGHWWEGHQIPAATATTEAIASSIAEVTKWLITD